MDPLFALPAVSPATDLPGVPAAGSATRSSGMDGFGKAFQDALHSISEQQSKADALQRRFQMNDPAASLEETMIATQTASLSFQAIVQVRNRLVSAYQEIMNLNV